MGNNNANTTFSGILEGPGSLTKIGSGTLTLTSSNTYTGPTTVTQGTLVVDGRLSSSAVSVNGGTLGGTGYLSSITVNAGGTLAPGDSLGTLHVTSSLILAPSSALEYGLDTPSTSDMVSCSSLTLNGQQFSDFSFTWTANFGPGTFPLIDFGSRGGIGLGNNLSGSIDGYPANLIVQGNVLELNVVPEPSTLALLGVGAIGLMGYAWRCHRS